MIGRAEVERVAELARLDLTDRELDRLAEDLAIVLRHFEAIRGLEPGRPVGFAPPTEPSGLRDDHPTPVELDVTPAGLAPLWADGFFLIPRLPAVHDPGDPAPSSDP